MGQALWIKIFIGQAFNYFMKIPQSFIEELKARLRVSEVVGQKVALRRAGREFIGLCPFHKEKSPSFSVNDEKGFFHCFGCGAHGDAIGFLKDSEGLSYPEAVERAAGLAGLAMPRFSREEIEREAKHESQQQVVEAVAAWFEAQLESGEGRLAREYLAQRGITPETVAKFRLGYAPENRDALLQAMRARGITEAQLIENGVLIQVEGRQPYARFRRRLMFPIRDRKSRVVAFGGRILPGEPNADAPKYLNSPETPLFHKGRMLYNHDQARRTALEAKRLIIAEGYMDVIALSQHGYGYAVAPLGTAVTAEQLQLAWSAADEPLMCLDADAAGARAMLRAANLAMPLLMPGKSLRFVRLPPGDDPDSLLKRGEARRFEDALLMATPLAEVMWEEAARQPAGTPEAKAALEHTLMQLAEQIKHPTVKQYYRGFFREKLWQRKGSKPTAPLKTATLVSPQMQGVAALFIALVLRFPALMQDGTAEERFLQLDVDAELQPLYASVMAALLEQPEYDSAALIAALRDEHRDAVEKVLAMAARQGLTETLDHTELSLMVQQWWPFFINKHDLARLQAECQHAEEELAQDMTEENLSRLTHLNAQKQALEREIARHYNEDPLRFAG